MSARCWVGGSTGTNFVGVLQVAQAMRRRGETGSIVTILCDGGERYAHSYYNRDWYLERGIPMVENDGLVAAAVNGETPLALPVAELDDAGLNAAA